jgi:signal transduction histidine kinase
MKNNSLFLSTRIKLTAFYLLIIMSVSTIFSLVIFSGINNELNHLEDFQRARQARIEQWSHDFDIPVPIQSNTDEIEAARLRLILVLALINGGILGISGLAGYFLAGRTLRPIQAMVDEQTRFISDASHELRTPLTALRSEIEVTLREKNLTPKDARETLTSNLEEVVGLQTLSDSLLELTNNTNGIAHASVSLETVIKHAVKSVKFAADQKEISIKLNVKQMTVLGDETKLIRLFVILFDNAIKYNPSKTKVSVVAKKTDHTVSVTVEDNGTGIKQEDLAHIFERFYRADKSRTKEVSGYGLGLSIAQKIVSQHHGSISVKSTELKSEPNSRKQHTNNGTQFIIKIPLA